MKQLSGLDASFLALETPGAPMHVGNVILLEPPPGEAFDFEAYKGFIESRLDRVRTTRERVVNVPLNLGHPYWIEDPDFNLDFHVHHMALPKPGGPKELTRLASHIFGIPLDRTRPLWEVTLVEGLDGMPGMKPGAFALISKVHHAAIDGASGTEMLGALFDTAPEPPGEREPARWAGEPVPGPVALLARTALNALRQPLEFAGFVPHLVKGVVMGTAVRQFQKVELPVDSLAAPRTRFNTSVTPHRNWSFVEFDLAAIKQVKTRCGVTVNDVILAICAGGLRRYLLEKGELPRSSLVAMLPVNIRDESQAGTQGNKVSAMLAALATDIEDPRERLEQIHKNTTSSKIYHQAVGAKKLSDITNFVPYSLGGLAVRLYTSLQGSRFHAPPFNTVITNVPGPQQPLYMNSARMLSTLGMGPIGEGMGLIHVVLSYDGRISIGVTTCREMLPDLDVYVAHLRAAYDELAALAEKAGGAPPARRAERA
jgi:diacylglycerol O-acyltransferase / wax synthase